MQTLFDRAGSRGPQRLLLPAPRPGLPAGPPRSGYVHGGAAAPGAKYGVHPAPAAFLAQLALQQDGRRQAGTARRERLGQATAAYAGALARRTTSCAAERALA